MKKFRQVLEGVDVISENLAKETKALAKEITDAAKRESSGDKKDFLSIAKLLTQNKLKDAAKYMSKLDTVVLEDLVTFIMGHEDVFKAMYPKARAGQYAASFARKESVEEGTLPPALQAYQDKKNGKKPKDDEKEVEEAMSPADKAKRLKMIRQAVEKMNSANMEKAKKDALKMMKDSGMFDEELEEAVDNWVVTVAKPVNKLKKGAEQKVKARSAFEAINKAMKLWGDPALKAAPMNSFSIQKEGFRPVPMFEDMSVETFAKFYS